MNRGIIGVRIGLGIGIWKSECGCINVTIRVGSLNACDECIRC
jgi:hypothetical protein